MLIRRKDFYYTIAQGAQAEIKIKGSRFIGETHLVKSGEEALVELETIRKREYDATHHCSAWKIGLAPAVDFKYSDDGEPNGTAGRPIYDSICGRDLTDVLVVVTRYFGGTKLGTGGLVRAYAEAAAQVLDKSGRKECFLTRKLRVTIEFPLYDQLIRLMQRFEVIQHNADFSDKVSLELEVRLSYVDRFRSDLIQLSAGKAVIEQIQEPD
ncbi:MAG TPA: YigZ family protein [candidate division Zixibacteria bacterium]|nr:YigZ family protein [candidate division Zixibacteria bacterium]